MTPLPQFMELNRNIILFLYGLVFFSLGIILLLQSRSYSRLALAHSLKWLAAFGIIHGSYEWSYIFIRIQSPNLSEETIGFWTAFQLVLLAVSYTCLFYFGLSLNRYPQWTLILPLAILGCWTLVVIGLRWFGMSDEDLWRNTANALARYMLSLPAGVISALSLYTYAQHRTLGLNVPHITRLLRVAGVALFCYALLSVLGVPPVRFFPGNLINSQTFVDVFTFPPLVFRSMIGLVLAVTMIRALEVFDIETARRIEMMEQQQILSAERERIARELHDGSLQAVYTAGLLVESAAHIAEPGSQVAVRLEHAVAALNHVIQDMRRNLSDLEQEKSCEPVSAALKTMLQEEQFESLVHIELTEHIPENLALSPVRMHHLLSIIRDTLTNIVRHARAKTVSICLGAQEGAISVVISDDGVGISDHLTTGYGLRYMRDRARLLGGDLNISSEPGKGTIVSLGFPLME